MKSFDKYIDRLNEDLHNLHYQIEIGVISYDKERKEELSVDLNNAQLMYLHENGTINTPARPVLQMTIDWANKNLIPETVDKINANIIEKDWGQKEIEKELNRMCMRMEHYARMLIKEKKLEPLKHPRKDGSDIPLLDTGQLMRSITCRLVNI